MILSQGKYLEKVLRTFGMQDAKAVITQHRRSLSLRSDRERMERRGRAYGKDSLCQCR